MKFISQTIEGSIVEVIGVRKEVVVKGLRLQAIRNLLGNIDLWAICFVNSSLVRQMVKMCFWIDQKGKETRFSIAFLPNDGDFFA